MPTVPGTHTVSPTIATTSEMNSFFRDPINFLLLPPHADLKATAAQSIPTGAFTTIGMNAENVDTDVDGIGGHDNVTNNARYTARYPGWYLCGGGVSFVANATGVRGAGWSVNGSMVDASDAVIIATSGAIAIRVPARSKLLFLNVGDYVEIAGFQDSGGALNTSVVSTDRPHMTVLWVSN